MNCDLQVTSLRHVIRSWISGQSKLKKPQNKQNWIFKHVFHFKNPVEKPSSDGVFLPSLIEDTVLGCTAPLIMLKLNTRPK